MTVSGHRGCPRQVSTDMRSFSRDVCFVRFGSVADMTACPRDVLKADIDGSACNATLPERKKNLQPPRRNEPARFLARRVRS